MSERNLNRISVIIPVGRRHEALRELYDEYRAGLDAVRLPYEFVFVMDGPHRDAMAEIGALIDEGQPGMGQPGMGQPGMGQPGMGQPNIQMVVLNRSFGESTAIMAGFERASGEIIMTLPAYPQIIAEDIPKLIAPLETKDLAQGWRWPRKGGSLERVRRSMFHGLVGRFTGMRLHGLGCGARAI